MASNQTSSYGLSQWEATDQVKRTDFNADNAKIHAALEELVSGKATTTALNSALSRITALESGKASQTDVAVLEDTVQQLTLDLTKIVVGSYTGNGTSPRTISLGAKPKAVLVVEAGGRLYYYLMVSQFLGGLAVDGHDAQDSEEGTLVKIVSNGFQVFNQGYARTNYPDSQYHYVAFL